MLSADDKVLIFTVSNNQTRDDASVSVSNVVTDWFVFKDARYVDCLSLDSEKDANSQGGSDEEPKEEE